MAATGPLRRSNPRNGDLYAFTYVKFRFLRSSLGGFHNIITVAILRMKAGWSTRAVAGGSEFNQLVNSRRSSPPHPLLTLPPVADEVPAPSAGPR